jgi:hypothetical protein
MAKASNGNAIQQCIDCCEQIKQCCEQHKAQGVQAAAGFNFWTFVLPALQAFLQFLQQYQPTQYQPATQAAPKKP